MIVLSPLQTQVAPGITAPLVEQESFRLHMANADAFSLEMCAEVCARCQHKEAIDPHAQQAQASAP